MAKKAKAMNPLIGRWRITWMEQWGQDFVDAEVEGFFEFKADGTGDFQFGYVSGYLNYKEGVRDGKPSVEFDWDGSDEMDPAQGSGWAVSNGDKIEGNIHFHQGDDSKFKAEKAESKT
jgi:hypothetical protein